MPFQQIAETIAANAVAFNLVSFLAGLLFGHRVQLWRDRRNERNAAKKPISDWLVKQMETTHAAYPLPDITEVYYLQQMLPWYQLRRFNTYWQRQKEELTKGYTRRDPLTGSTDYLQTPARQTALLHLLKICRHR